MTTTNYIPVKAVLSDLAMVIDEKYWNELVMYEAALKGFMKLRFDDMYEDVVATVTITNHKGTLPSNLKYLNQFAYKDRDDYVPMRLTSSPFFNSQCDDSLMTNTDCLHTFSIDSSLVVTTTLDNGEVKVSYKRFKQDEEGNILMPNDEDVKDAVFAYVLYTYWLIKDQMMEEGASQRMRFWLSMYNTLSTKVNGNMNMPDLNTMENMMRSHNRMLPRRNQFFHLFTKLGNTENAIV